MSVLTLLITRMRAKTITFANGVVDVARKMLALYGMGDIGMVCTGVGPGEKLSEELDDSSDGQIGLAIREFAGGVG